MRYREMVKQVQQKSGFSEREAKESLGMLVESLAVHLNEGERKDFASQLPQKLKDMALAVFPTEQSASEGMVEQFMRIQHVNRTTAQKQLLSSWSVLKDAISRGQIEHIQAQLPKQTLAYMQ